MHGYLLKLSQSDKYQNLCSANVSFAKPFCVEQGRFALGVQIPNLQANFVFDFTHTFCKSYIHWYHIDENKAILFKEWNIAACISIVMVIQAKQRLIA